MLDEQLGFDQFPEQEDGEEEDEQSGIDGKKTSNCYKYAV